MIKNLPQGWLQTYNSNDLIYNLSYILDFPYKFIILLPYRRHILLLEPENGRDATVASFLTWEYAITLSKDCNFKSGSVYNDRVLLQNVTILETETFPLLGDFCLLKIEDLIILEAALPKSFFPCFQDSFTQTVKDSLDLLRPPPTQAPTSSPGKV